MNSSYGSTYQEHLIRSVSHPEGAAKTEGQPTITQPMDGSFKHICLPVDGSEASFRAAATGVALAAAIHAKIYAFHVMRPLSTVAYLAEVIQFLDATYQKTVIARAQQHLDRVCAMARAADVPCASGYAFDQRPYCAIAGAIVREGCDLVVMATQSWSEYAPWAHGSETRKLIQSTDVPVLVLH